MHRSRRTSLSRARWLVPVLLGVLGRRSGAPGERPPRPRDGPRPAGGQGQGRTAGGAADRRCPRRPSRSTGTLRLRGIVTNTSDEAWQDINVHAFVVDHPDHDARRGWRRPRRCRTTPTSAPGYQTTKRSSRRRPAARQGHRLLAADPALGAADPRPARRLLDRRARARHQQDRPRPVADGRARTFIPLYRATTRKTDRHDGGAVPCPGAPRQHRGAARARARWRRLLGTRAASSGSWREVESAGSVAGDPGRRPGGARRRRQPGRAAATTRSTAARRPPARARPPATRRATGPTRRRPTTPRDAGGSGSDDPAAARAQAWLDRLNTVAGHQVRARRRLRRPRRRRRSVAAPRSC